MRPYVMWLATGALLSLAMAMAQGVAKSAQASDEPSAAVASDLSSPAAESEPTSLVPQVVDKPETPDIPAIGVVRDNVETKSAERSTDGSNPTPTPPKVVEKPPVTYVRDKQGRLVPLLGYSLEEIHALIAQQQKPVDRDDQPSRFSLQQLLIDGEANDHRAEFTSTYQFTVDVDDWIESPLLAGGAVLSEPAKYIGPGEHSVRFDAKNGAYFLRLRGAPRSTHEVKIRWFAPVKMVAGQRRLDVELPAAAASRMRLSVPLDRAAVTASAGAVTAEVERLDNGKSAINAWGLGGPLSLAWKAGVGAVTAAPSRLEAEGQIFARLDTRSVRFDATLTVRSLGDEFDRFQVRLPPETHFVPGEANSAYTLSGMEDSDLVTVQLAQKAKGPVEVTIRAERAYDTQGRGESVDLAGFEVLEAFAFRQSGHLGVAVAGDWQISVDSADRVRQTDSLPPELAQRSIMGFEYTGQPASLAVRILPRQTRITVEPQYVYYIERDRIRLDATFNYLIRGAKAHDLAIELPGWIPEQLGPAESIDEDEFWASDGPLNNVPLLHGVDGRFKLELSAYKRLSNDSDRIEFTLPIVRAELVEPALVAIVPANNVQLRPVEEDLSGLTRQTSRGPLELPAGEQSPLVYQADQGQGRFVAKVERLPRVVTVSADGTLDVRADSISVEQHFQYRVRHEPLDALYFEVPRQIEADCQWYLDESPPLSPFSTSSSDPSAASVNVRVPLGTPRVGTFTVKVVYRLPLALSNLDTGDPALVPLVTPREETLVSNRLKVTHDAALRVLPDDSFWLPVENAAADGDDGVPMLQLAATRVLSDVMLLVAREERRDTGRTFVDRAWVQTWIARGVRQDRAVFCLNNAEGPISLTLPDQLSPNRIEVKLNGKILAAQPDAKRTLTLMLTEQSSPHVVELKYQFADTIDDRGRIVAEFPQFSGNIWTQHFYWQLVLPSHRHLISASHVLTPEFDWRWNGFGWVRQPVKEQADLENWSSAEASSVGPETMNRYLFSVAGNPREVEIFAAGRGELVLVFSLAVWAFGLLLIYVRALRSPVALFVMGVVFVAIAAWQTAAALLFLQAAALGLAMVVLAMLLELAQTRRRAPKIVRSAGSSIVDSRTASTSIRTPAPIAPASTESLPGEIEMPSHESTHR